jgi:hypothetical protein
LISRRVPEGSFQEFAKVINSHAVKKFGKSIKKRPSQRGGLFKD